MSKVFLILAVGATAAGFVFRKQLQQFATAAVTAIQAAIIEEALKDRGDNLHLAENDRFPL